MRSKIICLLAAAVIVSASALAQAPDWTVNAASYNYSMLTVGIIKADRQEVMLDSAIVGAFVGNECRGVARPILQETEGRYFVYLLAYANSSTDTLTFKFYEPVKDSVYQSVDTLMFEIDGLKGSIARPFYWSNVELSNDAAIVEFSLKAGQLRQGPVNDEAIELIVGHGFDFSSGIPEFSLSEGAQLLLGDSVLMSGVSAVDFSEPVVFTVLSESEKTEREYTVMLSVVAGTYHALPGEMLVYPNPAGESVSVSHVVPIQWIGIYSLSGQVVKQMALPAGVREITIPSAGLAAGIYLLRVQSTKGEAVTRLVVE